MKTAIPSLCVPFVLLPLFAAAQQASSVAVHELDNTQSKFLRATLSEHEMPETIFWPLYEQYHQKSNEFETATANTLQELTSADDASNIQDLVRQSFDNQYEEAKLKDDYFSKVLNATNGTIALEFLQSEILFDLLLKSKLYESMAWSKPKWTATMLKDEAAKLTVLESTLDIPASRIDRFRLISEEFEFDYSRVVGHQLVFFENCIDDVAELTPGACKKLGSNFISMLQNETKVKQKYFKLLQKEFDPLLAAKFISFQEYFFTMAKLNVWSESIALQETITSRNK
jgi:hypothetical protein